MPDPSMPSQVARSAARDAALGLILGREKMATSGLRDQAAGQIPFVSMGRALLVQDPAAVDAFVSFAEYDEI